MHIEMQQLARKRHYELFIDKISIIERDQYHDLWNHLYPWYFLKREKVEPIITLIGEAYQLRREISNEFSNIGMDIGRKLSDQEYETLINQMNLLETKVDHLMEVFKTASSLWESLWREQ